MYGERESYAGASRSPGMERAYRPPPYVRRHNVRTPSLAPGACMSQWLVAALVGALRRACRNRSALALHSHLFLFRHFPDRERQCHPALHAPAGAWQAHVRMVAHHMGRPPFRLSLPAASGLVRPMGLPHRRGPGSHVVHFPAAHLPGKAQKRSRGERAALQALRGKLHGRHGHGRSGRRHHRHERRGLPHGHAASRRTDGLARHEPLRAGRRRCSSRKCTTG